MHYTGVKGLFHIFSKHMHTTDPKLLTIVHNILDYTVYNKALLRAHAFLECCTLNTCGDKALLSQAPAHDMALQHAQQKWCNDYSGYKQLYTILTSVLLFTDVRQVNADQHKQEIQQ